MKSNHEFVISNDESLCTFKGSTPDAILAEAEIQTNLRNKAHSGVAVRQPSPERDRHQHINIRIQEFLHS